MKSAVAIVFTLALAMGVQSSVLPLGLGPLGLGSLGLGPLGLGPLGVGSLGHGLGGPIQLVSGPQLVSSPLVPGSVAIQASAVPSVLNGGVLGLNGALLGGHGAVVAAPALGHGLEGQYVAKTRGAVHSAPLAGHIASAASINLAPAPGTI